MRIFAVVVAVVLALAQRADACGFWRMEDQEKHVTIGWLVNSASIEKADKRLAALYLDLDNPSGLRATLGKKVVYDIAGANIRRYGAVVGKRDGDNVTFGKRTYTVELSDRHDFHSVPAWKLTVKRGDDVIVTSDDASSLCSGLKREMTDTQAEEEVRRRVIFYLAWREVGF
jgi:hypothetical protein